MWLDDSAETSQPTFTLAIWVRPAVADVQQGIIRRTETTGNHANYRLLLTADNFVEFSYDLPVTGRTIRVMSGQPLPDGEWSLIVARLNTDTTGGVVRTFDLQLFINENREFRRYTKTGVAIGSAAVDPTGRLVVGFEEDNGDDPMKKVQADRFVGDIDEIALWNRLLTTQEILDLVETAPDPAPRSQSSAPGVGRRWARALARTSRLVIWPSWSKASSGRPGAGPTAGRIVARTSTLSARMTRSGVGVESQSRAVPDRLPSLGPPRCHHAVIVDLPHPSPVRSSATAAGVEPSAQSTTRQAPGSRWRRSRSGERPTTLTTVVSSAGQPIRARASVSEDMLGWIRTRSRPSNSIRVVPTPDVSGSPLASTTTPSEPTSASSAGNWVRSGVGHDSRR